MSRAARPRRSRAPIVVVVVGALLVAALLDRASSAPGPSAAPVAGPRIPARDAEVTAWYCAEGTSNQGGRADERVFVANIDDRPARAQITVMQGADQPAASRMLEVPSRSLASIRIADLLAVPEPGVVVEVSGGRSVVTHSVIGNGDAAVGPCAREPSSTWRFAGGTTVRGAQLWLSLFNPFSDDAIVDIAFLTDQGPLEPEGLQGFVVPRRTRVSVPVHDQAQRQTLVATEVVARRGRVVAEQALGLDGTDGRKGLALSLGAPQLATRWELASGLEAEGRTQTLSLANPGSDPATVRLDTRLDGVATLEPETVTVAARSSLTVDLSRVPQGTGFSLRARAARPIVAETLVAVTAPQPSAARGLATAIGSPRSARRWVVAPARASDRSDDFVAIVNTADRPVRVAARSSRAGGTTRLQVPDGGRLAAGRRVVLDLGAAAVPRDALLEITASGPVVVDRDGRSLPGTTLAAAVPDLGG